VDWRRLKLWALAALLAAAYSLAATLAVFATSWAAESLVNLLATWNPRFLVELLAAVGAMVFFGLLMFLIIDALALTLAAVWP
jgi:hypothetical protein